MCTPIRKKVLEEGRRFQIGATVEVVDGDPFESAAELDVEKLALRLPIRYGLENLRNPIAIKIPKAVGAFNEPMLIKRCFE